MRTLIGQVCEKEEVGVVGCEVCVLLRAVVCAANSLSLLYLQQCARHRQAREANP